MSVENGCADCLFLYQRAGYPKEHLCHVCDLEQRLAVCVAALKFYANADNYIGNTIVNDDGTVYDGVPIDDDMLGKRAREALAAAGRDKRGDT